MKVSNCIVSAKDCYTSHCGVKVVLTTHLTPCKRMLYITQEQCMQFETFMGSLIFFFTSIKEHNMDRPIIVKVYNTRRPYGCLAFIFDIIMTCITSGFWLIWIFVREMRRRGRS
jgi:hypothetical protein